jgi:hypothetical protein
MIAGREYLEVPRSFLKQFAPIGAGRQVYRIGHGTAGAAGQAPSP